MRLQINFAVVIRKQSLKNMLFHCSIQHQNWVMFKKKACHPIKKLGQIDRRIPCRLQWFVVAKSCGSGTSIDILLILNYPMGETRIPIWKKSLRKWTFKNSAQISEFARCSFNIWHFKHFSLVLKMMKMTKNVRYTDAAKCNSWTWKILSEV